MTLREIIDQHQGREGPLLPILNDVQARFGHISDAAVREIAAGLNLTRAEVYGVVSFYHDYRRSPAQRPVIKLCRAEACQARGVQDVADAAAKAAQGRADIETVYCLGLCSVGPAAMVGQDVYARLDAAGLERLIDKVAS